MALVDILQKVHGNAKLGVMIDQFLDASPGDYREPGWHPSEFCGICPRLFILNRLFGKPKQRHNAGLQRIFDVGTALHSWYQNRYLGPMGILWGKWVCLKCGHITWGYMPKEELCPGCRLPSLWDYREVPVKANLPDGLGSPIVGHSDGIIKMGALHYLFEFKTINENGFTWLKGAKDAHIAQARIYAELVRQGCIRFGSFKGKVSAPKISGIIIVYACKNGRADGSPVEREFFIDLDEDAARAELKRPFIVEKAIADKELPERIPECVSLLKKPAKTCPMSSYCFGGKTFKQLEEMSGKCLTTAIP
jgi:hypothetical protein